MEPHPYGAHASPIGEERHFWGIAKVSQRFPKGFPKVSIPPPPTRTHTALPPSLPGLPGLAFSGPKNDKFGFFYIGWPGHFFEFIKYLAFFKVYRRCYSKIKTFFLFKNRFWHFSITSPWQLWSLPRGAKGLTRRLKERAAEDPTSETMRQ